MQQQHDDNAYRDAGVASTLSRPPFSDICKLRDDTVTKPLIRGRYNGMCGGDPTQRERHEEFEHVAMRSLPSSSSAHAGVGFTGHGPSVAAQVEAYSRSAAGKTIDPAHQRTPLALEKTMHFLVEHYLRVPHTPLVYTEPFRIWGYLWDRLRGVRTTWAPQLPPSNVSGEGYVDSETGQVLPAQQLHRESCRRVRWLEFTAAALAVGGAYLCCSVEGCQRFRQDKKQFLESMSQCFTDLTVYYRAEQRHRNAEFFSVLLLLYGLQQELKVEDRSSFCRFETITVDGVQRLCPESASASVNLAQVYRELEKQPYMLETQPVRAALALIHSWATRQWFHFFELCRSTRLTLLQRAVVFQSFTYGRYRAVLDLVLPNFLVYPKVRVRHAIPVAELAEQLLMEGEHCLEFLRRMGLGGQLKRTALGDPQQSVPSASFSPTAPAPPSASEGADTAASSAGQQAGWHLVLCHPNSDPLVTAEELEERCGNKSVLAFPTDPSYFGFRVSHDTYRRFPDATGFPQRSAATAALAHASFNLARGTSPAGRAAIDSQSHHTMLAGHPSNTAVAPPSPPTGSAFRKAVADDGEPWREEDSAEGDDYGSENENHYTDEYGSYGSSDGHGASGKSDEGGSEEAEIADNRLSAVADAALLRQLGCPVNLMEVLEVYCPPYSEEVAALRLVDASEELFTSVSAHRKEKLACCRRVHRWARHWRLTATAVEDGALLDVPPLTPEEEEEEDAWVEKMELDSVSTASSIFDADEDDEEGLHSSGTDAASSMRQTRSATDLSSTLTGDGMNTSVSPIHTVISETRQLLSRIRSNALYTAAAAAAAAATQKDTEKVEGKAIPEQLRNTEAAHPPGSPGTLLPSQPRLPTGRPALVPCIVVPMPDNYSGDAGERCNSETSRVVVESPASVTAAHPAGATGGEVAAFGQPSTIGAPRSTVATAWDVAQVERGSEERPRADSVETVEPQTPPEAFEGPTASRGATNSFSPHPRLPPAPSLPPLDFHTAMPPQKPSSTVWVPGKPPIALAAHTPTGAQHRGDSSASCHTCSSTESSPMLGFSNLKPTRGTKRSSSSSSRHGDEDDDGVEDQSGSRAPVGEADVGVTLPPTRRPTMRETEGVARESARRQPLAAPLRNDGHSRTSFATATSNATPRHPSQGVVHNAAENARGIVEKLSRGSRDESAVSAHHDLVDTPSSSSQAEEAQKSRWGKRYKRELSRSASAVVRMGSQQRRAAAFPLRASCRNVFADACGPQVEAYLQWWVRLVHGDDRAVNSAAVFQFRHRGATGRERASGGHREDEKKGEAIRKRSCSDSGCDEAAGASVTYRGYLARARPQQQQRRQLSTASMVRSMRSMAQRLLTTCVLRSNLSEYTLLMWDLSLTPSAVQPYSNRDSHVLGNLLSSRSGHRKGGTLAPTEAFSRNSSDDARAARLSWGCSVAAVSYDEAMAFASLNAVDPLKPDTATWPTVGLVAPRRLRDGNEGEESSRFYAQDICDGAIEAALQAVTFEAGGAAAANPSLHGLLAEAVSTSLASVEMKRAEPDARYSGALQLTSVFVWVSSESGDSQSATVDLNDSGAAFTWLFENPMERWLVASMLPEMAFPSAFTSADGMLSMQLPSWHPSQPPQQQRCRSSKACRRGREVWFTNISENSPRSSLPVAHLLHLENCCIANIASAPSLPPAAHHFVTLLTRIALYGCTTDTLPRLRVRRDGSVRHAEMLASPSTAREGQASDATNALAATPERMNAPAVSNAHYTAVVGIAVTNAHAALSKARRTLAAIVSSEVAYTTCCAAGASTAITPDGRCADVQEQHRVAGVLLCFIDPALSRGEGTDTDRIDALATEVEDTFWELWRNRSRRGDDEGEAEPVLVAVRVPYGDVEGAAAAMAAGMQSLMSVYAQRVMRVLCPGK